MTTTKKTVVAWRKKIQTAYDETTMAVARINRLEDALREKGYSFSEVGNAKDHALNGSVELAFVLAEMDEELL